MADRAHSWTDWKIGEIEKELDRIYSRAQKELGEKADAYFNKFGDAWKKKQAEVDAGKLSQDDFNKWFQGKVATGEHWFKMEQQMAEELLHVNETATAYVNDQLPEVYSRNYNQTANGINGQISGYSFELVDASTVRRLATDDKTLLPYKYVDGKKDVRWNTQKVNSEVLQGILQGDSIPELSKRLENVVGMNKTSAIRNARTSCTSAENKGRMDMINDAEDKGVHVQKGWMATNDDRTRDSHADLNGTYVDSDELFDNGLEYPGDPNGDPSEVYNCRCTLVYKVVSIGDNLVEYPDEEKAEEQAEEEQHKVERNYSNDLASKMGAERYDKLMDMLDDCEYPEVQAMYEKRLDDVGVVSFNRRAAGYCQGTSISVDIEKDVEGSSLRKPGSVFYHEAGHANDHLLAKEKGTGWYYSTGWNGGEYQKTIVGEVNDMVSDVDKRLKEEFKEHKTDVDWLKQNGFLSTYSEDRLNWYADRAGVTVDDILSGRYKDSNTKYYVPSYSKSQAYSFIEKEIKNAKLTDSDWDYKYSDLSDILEGATKGKIQCGWGHGKTYWSRTDVAVEAFAEMSQAHVCGPESLEILEKYLPKSVDCYRRMIADIGG